MVLILRCKALYGPRYVKPNEERDKLSKTAETISLERAIWTATKKQSTFGCFEVTIGWFGKERVDYMTYDTKGVWRCYEIKVTKSDFRSKAHNTFCGHFNYYVMPAELFEAVKHDIPKHIGVYIRSGYRPFVKCVKKPQRQQLAADEQVLKNSMIRSLSRDVGKALKTSHANTK